MYISDYPYLVLYAILLILSYLEFKYPNKRVFMISASLVFLFYGLRAPIVGADTLSYVMFLTGENNYYQANHETVEYGFFIYREIVKQIATSYLAVMLINAAIILLPFYCLIKKYTKYSTMVLLMFFFLGCETTYIGALRQSMSISILILGMLIYGKENITTWKKTVLVILLSICSISIHTSAIIYLFVIVVAYAIPITSKKVYYVMIVSSALLGVVLKTVSGIGLLKMYVNLGLGLTSRLDGYSTWDSYEGAGLNILLRFSIVAFTGLLIIKVKYVNNPITKIFMIGVSLFNLLYDVPMVFRIVNPMIMFGTIYYTWAIQSYYSRKNKSHFRVSYFFVIIVFLYLLQSSVKNAMFAYKYSEDQMHPHIFIFQNYKKIH